MNAKNITTGVIHNASVQRGFLLQTCGRTNTLVALSETTAEITCKRCLKANPKPAAKPATPAPARKSTGPVAWGVFNADGTLRVIRETRKAAQAAADYIGHGCYAAKA